MISLRVRVALACTGVVSVLLGAGSWMIGRSIATALDREFDHVVIERLRASTTGIEFEYGGIEIHGQGPEVAAFSIHSASGEVIIGEPWMRPPPDITPASGVVLGTAISASGEHCRTAWQRIVPENDAEQKQAPLDVGIALSLTDLRMRQDAIIGSLIAGAIAVACAVIVVLTVILGRMLAPHAWLAEAVGNLDPRQPGRRLDLTNLPQELRGIAGRINDLCDRLERAYGLASSLHAAAAHELRTPLAGLRATIEVAAQPGGNPTAALTTCHVIAVQMQARIDNLLMAARIDAGQLQPRRDEIDVHALIRQAWQQVEESANARDLAVVWNLDGAGLAIADTEALRMVLANLCDNAVSHASDEHPISIGCSDSGNRVIITIANAARGMTPDAAAQVFTRGWRSSSSSPEGRHAGLGMGIARELVALMSGRIDARLVDGVFTVELTLPAPGVFEYW